MADALILFGLLGLIIGLAVFMWWDLDTTIQKEVRHGRLQAEQRERQAEDDAYHQHCEDTARRAQELWDAFNNPKAAERLHNLLNGAGGNRLDRW